MLQYYDFFHFVVDLFILANQFTFDYDFDPRKDIQIATCDCVGDRTMDG